MPDTPVTTKQDSITLDNAAESELNASLTDDNTSSTQEEAPISEDNRTEDDISMGIPKEEYKDKRYAELVAGGTDSYEELEQSLGTDFTVADGGESTNTDNNLNLNTVSSVLQYEAITAKPARSIWDSNDKVKEAFLKEFDGDEVKAEQAFIADYTNRVNAELRKQQVKRLHIQAEESYAALTGLDKYDDVTTFAPSLPAYTVNQSIGGIFKIVDGTESKQTRSVREAETLYGTEYIDANGDVQELHKGDRYQDMIDNPNYTSKDGREVIGHTYVQLAPDSTAAPVLKAVYEGDKLEGELVSVWDYTRNILRSNTLNRTGLERIWAPFLRTGVNTVSDLVSGFANQGIILADLVSGEDVGSDIAHKLARYRVSSTDADTGHPMTFNNIADFTVNMAAQLLMAWGAGAIAEGAMGTALGVSTEAEIRAAQTSGVNTALNEGLAVIGKDIKTLTSGQKALARALGTGFVYGPMMGYNIREVALQKGFSTKSADLLSLATTVLAGAIFAFSDIVPGASQARYLERIVTKQGEKQMAGNGVRMGAEGLEFESDVATIRAAKKMMEGTAEEAAKLSKMKKLGNKFFSKFPKLAKKISDANFAELEALNVPDGVRSMWWAAASGARTMGTVSIMNAALESLWSIPAINNKYDRYGELKPYFWTFDDTEFWNQWLEEFESSTIAGAAGGMIGTSLTLGWRKVIHPYSDDLGGLYETALKANQGDKKAWGQLSAVLETVRKNTKKGIWGSKVLSAETGPDGKFLSVEESVHKKSQAEQIRKIFEFEINTALEATKGYKGSFKDFMQSHKVIADMIANEKGIMTRFKENLNAVHEAMTDVSPEVAKKIENEAGELIDKATVSTKVEESAEKKLAEAKEKKQKEDEKAAKPEKKKEDEAIIEDPEPEKITDLDTILPEKDVKDYNKKLEDSKEEAANAIVASSGISKFNARKFVDSKAKLEDLLSGKETEHILMENFLFSTDVVKALVKLNPEYAKDLPELMDKLLAADEKALHEGKAKYEADKKIIEEVTKRVKGAKSLEDLIALSKDKSLLIDGRLPIDIKGGNLSKKIAEILYGKYKDSIEVIKQNLVSKYVLPVLRADESNTAYYAALAGLARAGNKEAKKLVKEYYKNFKEQLESRKVTEEDWLKMKKGEKVNIQPIPEDYTGKVYEITLKPKDEYEFYGVDSSDTNSEIGRINLLKVITHDSEGNEKTVYKFSKSYIDNILGLLSGRISKSGNALNGLFKYLGIKPPEKGEGYDRSLATQFNDLIHGNDTMESDSNTTKKKAYELFIAVTNLNEINNINSVDKLLNITVIDPVLEAYDLDKPSTTNRLQLEYFKTMTNLIPDTDNGNILLTTGDVMSGEAAKESLKVVRQSIMDKLYPEGTGKSIKDDFNTMLKFRDSTTARALTDPFTDVIGMFLRNFEIINGNVITTNTPLVARNDLASDLAYLIANSGAEAGTQFLQKLTTLQAMLDGAVAPSEAGYEDKYRDILIYAKENFTESVLGNLLKSAEKFDSDIVFKRIDDAKVLTSKLLTRMAMIELFTNNEVINSLAELRELNAKIFNGIEFFSPISSDDKLRYSKTMSRYIYDPVRLVEYSLREKAGTLSKVHADELSAMRARQDILQNVVWNLLHTGTSMSSMLHSMGETSKGPEALIGKFKQSFLEGVVDISGQFEVVAKKLQGSDNASLLESITEFNNKVGSIKDVADLEEGDTLTELSMLYKKIGEAIYSLNEKEKTKLIAGGQSTPDILAMTAASVSEFRDDIAKVVDATGQSPTFEQSRAQFLAYASGVQKLPSSSKYSIFSNLFYKDMMFIEGFQGSGKTTVASTVAVAIQNRLKVSYGLKEVPKIVVIGSGESQTNKLEKSILEANGKVKKIDGATTTATLYKILSNTDNDVIETLKDVSTIVIDEATFIQAKSSKNTTENESSGLTDLENIMSIVNKVNTSRKEDDPKLRLILLGSSTQGGYEDGMNTLQNAIEAESYDASRTYAPRNIGVADVGMILSSKTLKSQFRYNISEIQEAVNQILQIKLRASAPTQAIKQSNKIDVTTTYGMQSDKVRLGGVRLRTRQDPKFDIWNDTDLIDNMEKAIKQAEDKGEAFTIAIVYDKSKATIEGLKDSAIKNFALKHKDNIKVLEVDTVTTVQGGEFDYIIGEVPEGMLVAPTDKADTKLNRWGRLSMLVGRATDYADFQVLDNVPIESKEKAVINRVGAYAKEKILELWKPLYDKWAEAIPVKEEIPDGGEATETPVVTKDINASWENVTTDFLDIVPTKSMREVNINNIIEDTPQETVADHIIRLQAEAAELLKAEKNETRLNTLEHIKETLLLINKAFSKEIYDSDSLAEAAAEVYTIGSRHPEDAKFINKKLEENNIIKAYMNTSNTRGGIVDPKQNVKKFTAFTNQLYSQVNEETVKNVLDDFTTKPSAVLAVKYELVAVMHTEPGDANEWKVNMSIVAKDRDTGTKVVIGIIPMKASGNLGEFKAFDSFIKIKNDYENAIAGDDNYGTKVTKALAFANNNDNIALTKYGGRSRNGIKSGYAKDSDGNIKRIPGIYVEVSLTGTGEDGTYKFNDIIKGTTIGYIHTYDGVTPKIEAATDLHKISEDTVIVADDSIKESVEFLGKVKVNNDFITVAYDKDGTAIGPAIVYKDGATIEVRVVEFKGSDKVAYMKTVDTKFESDKAAVTSFIDNAITNEFTKTNAEAFLLNRSKMLMKGAKVTTLETLQETMGDSVEFSPIIGMMGAKNSGRMAVLYRYGRRGSEKPLSNPAELKRQLKIVSEYIEPNDTPTDFYSNRNGIGIMFLDSPRVTIKSLAELVPKVPGGHLSRDITRRVASVNSEARKGILRTLYHLIASTDADTLEVTKSVYNKFLNKFKGMAGIKSEDSAIEINTSPEMKLFLKNVIDAWDTNSTLRTIEGNNPIFYSAEVAPIKMATHSDKAYDKFDLAQLIYVMGDDPVKVATEFTNAMESMNLFNDGMVISPILGSKISASGDWVIVPKEEVALYKGLLMTTADFIARPSLLISSEFVKEQFYSKLVPEEINQTPIVEKEVAPEKPAVDITTILTKGNVEKVMTIKSADGIDIVSMLQEATLLPKAKAKMVAKMIFREFGEIPVGNIFKSNTKFGSNSIDNLSESTKSLIKNTIIDNSREYNFIEKTSDAVSDADIDVYNIRKYTKNGVTLDNIKSPYEISVEEGEYTIKIGNSKLVVDEQASNLYKSIKEELTRQESAWTIEGAIQNGELIPDAVENYNNSEAGNQLTEQDVKIINKVIQDKEIAALSKNIDVADFVTSVHLKLLEEDGNVDLLGKFKDFMDKLCE